MYLQDDQEESAQSQGLKWFGKMLAVAIILIVAAYGDVMYLELMSGKFPNGGPLLFIAYLGAFTSFLSMVYMLIGKNILFAPGKQMVLAWLVFAVELVMVALNILLVYQGPQSVTGILAVWYSIAPATPVFNMVGVALLYFLDEEQLERHEQQELALRERRMQRQLTHTLHRANIDVRQKQLAYMKERLADAVDTEDSQRIIAQTAHDMNARMLSELSGKGYILPERARSRQETREGGNGAETVPFFERNTRGSQR